MTQRRPGAVAGVIAATAAVALVLTVPVLDALPRAPGAPVYRVALLGVLVLAGVLQVHVRHRSSNTEAFDLFWVALAVCAVAFPPGVLVACAALGKLASQLLLRVEAVKGTFNTVMTAASAAAIGATLALLPDDLGLLPALALAMAAGWVVNHVALAGVLSAAGVAVVGWEALGRWAAHGATTSALGILLAVAYSADPTTVVLFVVPAVVLHGAGRALVSANGERRRLSAGAAASRVLSGATEPDLAEYCSHLGSAFGSPDVCLLLEEGAPPLLVPQPDDRVPPSWVAAVLARVSDDAPVAVTLDGPVREVLAVRLPGRPGTLLAVAEPTGARDRLPTELAFLSATAAELEAFRQAEMLRAEARATLSRLETVLAAVAEGIVTVDAEGRVADVNAAGARITGHDAAALGRAPVSSLGLERPDGLPWEPDVRAGTADVRLQVQAGEAGVRDLVASVAPIVLDGEPGAVVVLRDVSAEVERERARRRFLVGLGHELRTPLTPLLGWAQTLRRRPEVLDGPARTVVVDALESQSARLARLVDNLLTAVDPVSVVSARRPLDLVALAEKEVAAAAPLLGPRRVEVVADGPVEVHSSPTALSNILSNLLANVGRYVPESGSAQVRVRREGDAAVVTVVDDGPGVPPERREAVFDLFAHGSGSEANPGAGVGLTTSRTLARVLGGDLDCVDPAPERSTDLVPVPRAGLPQPGAAFRLVLPLVPPAQADDRAVLVSQMFA